MTEEIDAFMSPQWKIVPIPKEGRTVQKAAQTVTHVAIEPQFDTWMSPLIVMALGNLAR